LDFERLKISIKDRESISDSELFPTNHNDVVFVQTINGCCKVLSLKEFEKEMDLTPDTYFTRAKYDIKNKTLTPPFSKWDKMCSCRKPQNPH
jgi:hypothetical protein